MKYSREWWKKRLPMIQAFADEETVQLFDSRLGFPILTDCVVLDFSLDISCYRIKPKTIMVNGIEIEAPILKEPEGNPIIFVTCLSLDKWFYVNHADCIPKMMYERGLVHATKEGAVAHAKAMLVTS